MALYKSAYDRIIAEMQSEGKIHVFSEETNIQILKELNAGEEKFAAEQKVNEVHSELELANIVLNL